MMLPDIDPDNISSLDEAKKALHLLMNSFENLIQLYIKQEKKIEKLEEENRILKGQPKKPQFHSHGLKQPTSQSVRKLLKEKGVWHKSAKLAKLEIDTHISLPELESCGCGSSRFKTLRTNTKIVQGIIFKRNNTTYHGRDKQCLNCGKIYPSIIPDEIKGVSFDPALKSLISYLKYGCRMTHPLLYRMFTGMGIQISSGEISSILLDNGTKLNHPYQHLKTAGFKNSSYLQSDSTGSKRKDKRGKVRNNYLQIVSNKLLSVFAITKSYNQKTLEKLLTKPGRDKPYVSDGGSPNGSLWIKIKQLCWVHEIRHYQKLFSFFNPYQKEKEQILAAWSKFYHLAKAYGKNPIKEKAAEIEALFDEITSINSGYDLLDKQLKITRKKKHRLLTFLDYPFLPIHNNQCEQDLREFVIQRKISGETKSVKGDRTLERHLSIIQTAQKQGLDIFQTLHGLLTGILPPQILTANIS